MTVKMVRMMKAMTMKTMKNNKIVIDTEYEYRNFIQEQKDNYKARIDVLEGGILGIIIGTVTMLVAMIALALIL